MTNLIDKRVETVGVCDTEVEAGSEAAENIELELDGFLEVESISLLFPFSCSFNFMITR